MARINRRELLTKAGVGTVASAALLSGLAEPAQADLKHYNFDVATVADSGIVEGVGHSIFLTGSLAIHSIAVTGGGRFVHFDRLSPPPKRVLSTGTWKARRLEKFNVLGEWGGLAAGIVEFAAILVTDDGKSKLKARVQFVSNLRVANLVTGQHGGITLLLPGTIFDVGGSAGPFVNHKRHAKGFLLSAPAPA